MFEWIAGILTAGLLDATCVGIVAAFFAIAWSLVWALGHLQGERQS